MEGKKSLKDAYFQQVGTSAGVMLLSAGHFVFHTSLSRLRIRYTVNGDLFFVLLCFSFFFCQYVFVVSFFFFVTLIIMPLYCRFSFSLMCFFPLLTPLPCFLAWSFAGNFTLDYDIICCPFFCVSVSHILGNICFFLFGCVIECFSFFGLYLFSSRSS